MMALLLTGCGPARERQNFERWQQRLGAAEEIRCQAEITASAEGETDSFRVQLCRQGEETVAVVTAPETIRGITCRKSGADGTLEYDGLVLSFSPAVERTAPCEGGHLLLETLTDGYLTSMGADGEYRVAEMSGPGGETVSVWLTEGYEPVYAEIRRGESTELILRLEDWEIKERENGHSDDQDMG